MAIPSRHSSRLDVIAGQRTFFVTSSIWGKRALLQSDRSATLFRTVLYEYRCQGKYRLHEFVIMPDHFHALTTVSFGRRLSGPSSSLREDFLSAQVVN